MRIEIMQNGVVVDTILADEAFAEQQHPGAWRLAQVQDVEPAPASQFDKDEARYKRRAAVKDSLLAYMAADNMSRVRSGAWTVSDLTGLMADPAVAAANAYMSTLSFELAAQAISAATSPLLTAKIKAAWTGKLQEHFYLKG